MGNEDKYFICKKIDEPKRYVGLTLDEFIPVITISGACFLLRNLFVGFVLSGIVCLVIRHFKKGQGVGWFLNLLYWHLPLHFFGRIFFIKTPPSSQRHWLS